jgi:FkbM family methyltransferase
MSDLTRPIRLAFQNVAIGFARPYISRELPGWGHVYSHLVGSYQRNWLWKDAGERTIRDKRNHYLVTLNLEWWADRLAFFLGRWSDLGTLMLIDAVAKPGDVVVDIGANRGFFALAASHAVGPAGKVVCFEPNPACTRQIRRECEKNEITNIEIHDCALGQEHAHLTLSIPAINSGEATLGKTQYADVEKIDVDVEVGDEQLAALSPALIKIDVEGFECEVVDGIVGCIERCQPVVVTEVFGEHLERCGASKAALFSRFEALGYVGYRAALVKEDGRYQLKLELPPADDTYFDAVWLPRGSAAKFAALIRD